MDHKDSSPQISQHPFDQPSADLILRSADHIDFRVHTQILAQSSSVFATMLTLPQPAPCTPSEDNGDAGPSATPVVSVSEDGATLDLLLRLVYPIPKPYEQMEDAHAILPAMVAATKYDMALPIQIISERIAVITLKNPLQVWAAACRTGLERVARQAAEALKASWTDSGADALSFMDGLGDMAGISAGDYYRLKRFLDKSHTEEPGAPAQLLSPSPEDGCLLLPPPPDLFSTDLPSPDMICRPSSQGGSETPALSAHQIVLSMRSPVLKARLSELRDAFSSGSSSTAAPSQSLSMPEVMLDFDEGPEVVSVLLRACYDVEEALPTALDLLAKLVVASQKYKMAFIAPRVRAAWDEAAGGRPFAAYFVALAHGLKACAQEAARNVLRVQLKGAHDPVMEDAPALSYHRLLVYYDSCSAIVKKHLVNAVNSIPEDLNTSYYGNLPSTEPIKAPLRGIATTVRNVPKGELVRSLGDAVITGTAPPKRSKKNVGSVAPASWVLDLVYNTLRCVVSTPAEIDEAVKKVGRPSRGPFHRSTAFSKTVCRCRSPLTDGPHNEQGGLCTLRRFTCVGIWPLHLMSPNR